MSMAQKILSNSANGLPITATVAGALIHTAQAPLPVQNGIQDQVFLWAANLDAAEHQLTLVITGGQVIKQLAIEAHSRLELVLPGIPINNGKEIYAIADAADCIVVVGYYYAVNY